ncbi:MAG: hypothetical protein EP329_03665 [Deltaproteobacteria bacterium]|nr:MAG: hypothetical protein EP329_03665 [Deltaproteobacteria bacterium]
MRSVRAALTVAIAGLLGLSTTTAALAATPCVDPCDALQLAAEGQLASLAAGDAEMGRTSCEIERSEGDSDWIIHIKHDRNGDGPKTSRCVIVPERAKDEAPKAPKRDRGEAPGPDTV